MESFFARGGGLVFVALPRGTHPCGSHFHFGLFLQGKCALSCRQRHSSRAYRWPLAAVFLPLALLLCTVEVAAQKRPAAATETVGGLHSVTFDASHGKVLVHLPDDMAAGDTISGTVFLEPKGKTAEEKADNLGQLAGYVLEVDEQKVSLKDASMAAAIFTLWIPPAATTVPLKLLGPGGKKIAVTEVPCTSYPAAPQGAPEPTKYSPDRAAQPGDYQSGRAPESPGEQPASAPEPKDTNGKKVSRGQSPVQPTQPSIGSPGIPDPPVPLEPKPIRPGPLPPLSSEPQPSDFQLPPLAQAGRACEIRGPFDGDFRTTGVRIGDKEVPMLAESPRKVVVESPTDVIGPTTLELREREVTAEGQLRNVAVRLSAPKLHLKKGEPTTLTISVEGLEGLQEPLELVLFNKTPGVVDLQGGARQILRIGPADLAGGGVFTTSRILTGLTPGSFAINALLFVDLCPDECSPKGNTQNRSAEMAFTAVSFKPEEQQKLLRKAKVLTFLPRTTPGAGQLVRKAIDVLPHLANTRGFEVWVRVCCEVCEETHCGLIPQFVMSNLEWVRHCSDWKKVMTVSGLVNMGDRWEPVGTTWKDIEDKVQKEADKISCP